MSRSRVSFRLAAFCLACGFAAAAIAEPAQGENLAPLMPRDFEFLSGGNLLSGIIDEPPQAPARALIIFVHGSGGTDIRQENRYSDLRRRFTALGITCVTWDKTGQGKSAGRFDDNQPLEESTREVLDAVAWLRQQRVPGSQRMGLWATSRGGWVAPLALARDPALKFWISVSGVPAEDNKYYLMAANLPLEGREPEEVRRLLAEWTQGRRLFLQGESYDAYLAATANLRSDPAVVYFAGDLTGTRQAYESEQSAYLQSPASHQFEPTTLALIRVPNFEALLDGLEVDVLAMFGERDTNVDWRRTRALYEATLGRNPRATLQVRTFPEGNHNLSVSATGSVREVGPSRRGHAVTCYLRLVARAEPTPQVSM